MNKSYIKIIDKLESLCLTGNSYLKDFGSGSIWEIAGKERKYPCIWFDNEVNSHGYSNGKMTLRFDVYIFDLVYNDESNENEILSDTLSASIDFVNEVSDDNYDKYGFWIDKTNQINFQQFTEEWDDKVSGTKFTIDLIIPDKGSMCENIYSGYISVDDGTVHYPSYNFGSSGTSGTSGINGSSGTSGASGVDGTSGSSGTSGPSSFSVNNSVAFIYNSGTTDNLSGEFCSADEFTDFLNLNTIKVSVGKGLTDYYSWLYQISNGHNITIFGDDDNFGIYGVGSTYLNGYEYIILNKTLAVGQLIQGNKYYIGYVKI